MNACNTTTQMLARDREEVGLLTQLRSRRKAHHRGKQGFQVHKELSKDYGTYYP